MGVERRKRRLHVYRLRNADRSPGQNVWCVLRMRRRDEWSQDVLNGPGRIKAACRGVEKLGSGRKSISKGLTTAHRQVRNGPGPMARKEKSVILEFVTNRAIFAGGNLRSWKLWWKCLNLTGSCLWRPVRVYFCWFNGCFFTSMHKNSLRWYDIMKNWCLQLERKT